MAFGADIKRLREESRISAQKLADLIGIDAERLRKWEQKDLSPRDQDTKKIEKFFGISLEEIGKLHSIKKFLKVPNDALDHPADHESITTGYENSAVSGNYITELTDKFIDLLKKKDEQMDRLIGILEIKIKDK